MAHNTKSIVTDVNNKPIPQYYNPSTDSYEPIYGRDGANSFIERGRIVKDVFSASKNVTKEYETEMFGVGIVNDGLSDVTVKINGLSILIKPGESFDDLFEPFKKIQFIATGSFRAVIRE